jgi:putative hydrolase of the HAD superfamily
MAVLVLDVDGVVIRGHRDGGRWDKNLERDLGIAPAALQENFFRPHWRGIATGDADMRAVLDLVWPQMGCPASAADFVDYWFEADSAVDGAVLALVDAWRAAGNFAALATVQEHGRADYIWRTLGLKAHFDDLLYSAALGAAKPDAQFYARAFAELPARTPGEILFLDDHLPNSRSLCAGTLRRLPAR